MICVTNPTGSRRDRSWNAVRDLFDAIKEGPPIELPEHSAEQQDTSADESACDAVRRPQPAMSRHFARQPESLKLPVQAVL
jgi:hypothetical protein